MVAVLAWLPLLSPAAAAEASSDRDGLIASLEGLKKAVNEKIASDIDDVAWALWSVHEIEEARFLADLIGAPLAVIEQAVASVAAIKSVQDVEAGLANAYSTPLSLVAYLMGLSQLEQAGTNLQMALDGPTYSSAVRALYDGVGRAQSVQGAAHALNLLLDPRGPGGPLSIRAPEQARARGTPSFVHRPGDVRRFVAEALNQLARDLATGALEVKPPVLDALRGRVDQATLAIKRSKSAPLDVPPTPGSGRSQDIRLGAIAGFRAAEGDLMAANARHLTAEAVSVRVKAVKAAGSAILLYQTLDLGGRLTTLQSSIVSADSIAWGIVERSFSSNVRELLAAVPQQMVLALGPELTNAWFVVEELVASIRGVLDATTGTADTSDTVPREQVAITMGDGSVLKGQLEDAKVPFVSGYGTIEVATNAITSFADGWLSLDDGSVLKGAFGDGDVGLTTSQGALKIAGREIVAMSRSGTPEPVAEDAAGTMPAPAVAQDRAVLVGRVLDRFNQPVAAATVRIIGSNLRTTTDSSGNYRLPYVPGDFRVVIEKLGHDSEEIELELAQATSYPLEDKYLTPVPRNAGLYFKGKRAWLPTSPCQIERVERDAGDFSGGVNRWVARAQVMAPIVNDDTSHFLDLSGAKRVALLPVAADGTILRSVREGGVFGMNQWATNHEPIRREVDKIAAAVNWGTVGNDRRVFWADLRPGIYALVSLPAVELGAFTAQIGPTCYMFELTTAAQAEEARRVQDWFTELERRVAAHEKGPWEATWPALRDHFSQWEALLGTERVAAMIQRDPSIDALLTRLDDAINAPARAAAQAGDWQAVETWADRALALSPYATEPRSLKDQAVAALRGPSSRIQMRLRVEPGQTTPWIQVQGGCAIWNSDGASVWIATQEGKVVLFKPGISFTHIAFTAPETRPVNVRYYIDYAGNCSDPVP